MCWVHAKNLPNNDYYFLEDSVQKNDFTCTNSFSYKEKKTSIGWILLSGPTGIQGNADWEVSYAAAGHTAGKP